MSTFLSYAVPGVPHGCDFALMAVGLVLTFRATGVFNLAFGAQAFAAAFVFDLLVRSQGLPVWAAFVMAVVVLSPLWAGLSIGSSFATSPWHPPRPRWYRPWGCSSPSLRRSPSSSAPHLD